MGLVGIGIRGFFLGKLLTLLPLLPLYNRKDPQASIPFLTVEIAVAAEAPPRVSSNNLSKTQMTLKKKRKKTLPNSSSLKRALREKKRLVFFFEQKLIPACYSIFAQREAKS